jgi:hypothetical protein
MLLATFESLLPLLEMLDMLVAPLALLEMLRLLEGNDAASDADVASPEPRGFGEFMLPSLPLCQCVIESGGSEAS